MCPNLVKQVVPMRILLLNQDWLAEELRELGHEVVTCGHKPTFQVQIPKRVVEITEVLARLPNFSPDVLLFLDDSMPALMVSGLDTCDIPSAFYSVDAHQHEELHPHFAALFDHVFVAQKDYVPNFERSGTPTTWLPLWAPRYLEPAPFKKHSTAFVGTLDAQLNPRRVAFFRDLALRVPIHVSTGAYWDVFPFSQIVVNQTVKGDLNFRVFEAMMCGALLLTEKTSNGLLDLFKEGTHLITYQADSVEQVVEIVQSLRENPQRLAELARAGREEVITRHTGMHRARELDRVLRTLTKQPRYARRHYISMVNNAVINTLLVKAQKEQCYHAALSAMTAAEAGLQRDLAPSEVETMHLIATCTVFDQLTSTDTGARLIRRFHERHPSNTLLTLARIHTLLRTGDRTTALSVASSCFQVPPEQTCVLAQQIVPQIARGEIQPFALNEIRYRILTCAPDGSWSVAELFGDENFLIIRPSLTTTPL